MGSLRYNLELFRDSEIDMVELIRRLSENQDTVGIVLTKAVEDLAVLQAEKRTTTNNTTATTTINILELNATLLLGILNEQRLTNLILNEMNSTDYGTSDLDNMDDEGEL